MILIGKCKIGDAILLVLFFISSIRHVPDVNNLNVPFPHGSLHRGGNADNQWLTQSLKVIFSGNVALEVIEACRLTPFLTDSHIAGNGPAHVTSALGLGDIPVVRVIPVYFLKRYEAETISP